MLYSREVISLEFLNEELLPLLEKHYLEIAHYQDIPLKPNFELYLRMENQNTLRCFTVRDDDGSQLIGYAVFFVNQNLHYQTSKQAVQDVLYIEKSARGMSIGKSFINWCDSQLRKEDCQVVYHHVKQAHNFGKMLETLDYKLVDLIYARRLDEVP